MRLLLTTGCDDDCEWGVDRRGMCEQLVVDDE